MPLPRGRRCHHKELVAAMVAKKARKTEGLTFVVY
jgi:hypothetical protein